MCGWLFQWTGYIKKLLYMYYNHYGYYNGYYNSYISKFILQLCLLQWFLQWLLQWLYYNGYIKIVITMVIIQWLVQWFINYNGIFIQWLYYSDYYSYYYIGSTNQLFDGGVDLEEHRGALLVYHRHIVTTRHSTSIPVGGVPEICVGQPPLVRTVNQTYRRNRYS